MISVIVSSMLHLLKDNRMSHYMDTITTKTTDGK